MDSNKAEVIDQIRELNMLLIQSKLHVSRVRLAQGRMASRAGNGQHPDTGTHALDADDLPAFHGQGRLLRVLGLRPDKPEMNQRELGFILGMSRQAVGELLAKLEQKGLVTRRASEADRRTLVVRLTDEGKAAARQVREAADDGGDILDCLDERELEEFSGYLKRIIENAETRTTFGDEFAERRRAMREFLSLNHASATADDGRTA